MKTLKRLLLMACMLIPLNMMCVSADSGIVKSVDFAIGGKSAYVIAAGEVTATAAVDTASPLNLTAITASYEITDGNKALIDVSVNPQNIPAGSMTVSCGTVTAVASGEVTVYFWEAGKAVPLQSRRSRAIAKPQKLNTVSRNASLKSISLESSGVIYDGFTNTQTGKTSFYTNSVFEDKTNVGVSVNGTVQSVDFTAAKPCVTVTAPQGNTKEYEVMLCDAMTEYWNEKWTGAEITDGNKSFETTDYIYDYPCAFAPTYGTWGAGLEDETMKKGYWDTGNENTLTTLAIEDNVADAVTGEEGTNTALTATVSGEKHKRFIMRPNATLQTGVYSMDFMQSATNIPRMKLYIGGVYFLIETSGCLAFRSENIGVVGKIQNPYPTVGQWHNMTVVETRDSSDTTMASVELYVDKKYIGSCIMKTFIDGTDTESRYRALSNAQAFAFAGLNGKGKMYFDNNRILGK